MQTIAKFLYSNLQTVRRRSIANCFLLMITFVANAGSTCLYHDDPAHIHSKHCTLLMHSLNHLYFNVFPTIFDCTSLMSGISNGRVGDRLNAYFICRSGCSCPPGEVIISDNQPTNMEVFHNIHSVYQMLFFIPDVSTVPVTNSDYSERKG